MPQNTQKLNLTGILGQSGYLISSILINGIQLNQEGGCGLLQKWTSWKDDKEVTRCNGTGKDVCYLYSSETGRPRVNSRYCCPVYEAALEVLLESLEVDDGRILRHLRESEESLLARIQQPIDSPTGCGLQKQGYLERITGGDVERREIAMVTVCVMDEEHQCPVVRNIETKVWSKSDCPSYQCLGLLLELERIHRHK